MEESDKILKEAGITPTAVRILVYRCLLTSLSPLSLSDLEVRLESVDKSTISRTLSLFRKYHLVHSFNDGSGSVKYELCKSTSKQEHDDMHVHFRCEKCGETFCLSEIKVPQVELPEGFEAHGFNYVISGICNNCSHNEDTGL